MNESMVESGQKPVDVVVVGSIGIDTIETPSDRRESILGGSASYACAAASFFSSVGMVGIVGEDFPAQHHALYENFGVDLCGLQKVEGETFRWSGVYEENMDDRRTLSTELNVFENFSPELPEAYRKAPFFLLGNISPELQLHVLSQVEGSGFVVADTMDLWINVAREALVELISKVHMLTLNESEARLLTGEHNLKVAAQRILDMGPQYVVIKKGGHGALLIGHDELFLVPAYPIEDVIDPTGAGDSFAGGLMGFMVQAGAMTKDSLRNALLGASVLASFGVEDFSLSAFESLDRSMIDARLLELREMIRV